MPNGDYLLNIDLFAQQLTETLNQPTSAWDLFNDPFSDSKTALGTVSSGGTNQGSMRVMSGRFGLSQSVPKTPRCTYLDWEASPGDGK